MLFVDFWSLRDKIEKQEGSVLTQRYISHLLRKAFVYRGFGGLSKKQKKEI